VSGVGQVDVSATIPETEDKADSVGLPRVRLMLNCDWWWHDVPQLLVHGNARTEKTESYKSGMRC